MELMERSTNFQTRHDRHVMQRATERKESENRIMFPDDEGKHLAEMFMCSRCSYVGPNLSRVATSCPSPDTRGLCMSS